MRKNGIDAVAAKTMEKIAKEEANLMKLENKREEIDAAIKECRAELARLRELEKQEKLTAIAAALAGKSVSVDDLLAAAFSGDMLTLQEKIEDAGAGVSEPSAPEQDEEAELSDETTGEVY